MQQKLHIKKMNILNNVIINKNTMLPIQSNQKITEIISLDYKLIPVLSRLGISFGFGNETIEEYCIKQNMDVHFALEILNSYHNPNYFPSNRLTEFKTELIIQYLLRSHQYFLYKKIPDISILINELIADGKDKSIQNVSLLNNFFKEYLHEIELHFNEEEVNVFPYIRELQISVTNKTCSVELTEKIKEQSIIKFEKDHSNLEDKIHDLKNLIMKYFPPIINQYISQKLLLELFRFEKDLSDHARMEDQVLIPKVKILEQEVISQAKKHIN